MFGFQKRFQRFLYKLIGSTRPPLTVIGISFKVQALVCISNESTHPKLQNELLNKLFDRAVGAKIAKIATEIAKIAIWRIWLKIFK